ncbi:MAG: hypothetical protein C3F11_15975 [Methylocystaceae bacterium]|nr:MAG: hypothetical protein C3F11_15975 [Methylocystaceae bacterium]
MTLAAKRLTLAAGLVVAASGATAQNVGNIGAVNQTARGAPPGQAARVLSLGAGVVDRERVETSGDGNAQIVFLDTSTLTIGRNSAVTIDRFVYDGDAGAGRQAISAAKGVLRFVGGGVSHGGGATIRTPTATIGVRGGTGLFALGEPQCGTLVVNQYGVLTVAARGGQAPLTRSGVGVCISSGGTVSEPFRVPAETIARLNAALGSGPRQTGGALEPPTNVEARRRLGDARPPSDLDAPGLETLNVIWTGNSLAQSRAGVENQPLPPVSRNEIPYPDYADSYPPSGVGR